MAIKALYSGLNAALITYYTLICTPIKDLKAKEHYTLIEFKDSFTIHKSVVKLEHKGSWYIWYLPLELKDQEDYEELSDAFTLETKDYKTTWVMLPST